MKEQIMKLKNSLLTSILLVIALFLGTSNMYSSSPRMILVEEATNTGCGPCATYNPDFQEYIMDHLSEVIPVVYHWYYPSDQDPFYLTDVNMNMTRVGYYNINGVPSGVVNGSTLSNILPNTVETKVATFRGQTSPITITIDEQRNGQNVNFTVNVTSDNDITAKKLRVVAVEFSHNYNVAPGSNGEKEFYWLARKMFPSAAGQDLNVTAGETFTYTNSFTIPTGDNGWNADQMYIVAFVQDDSNKEILQAKSSQKMTTAKITASNQYLKVDPGQQVSQTLTVTNPNNVDLDFKLSINTEGSYLPTGWSAQLSETEISIAAGASQDVQLTFTAPDAAGLVYATVDATPWGEDLGTVRKGTISIYCLSNKTKYALYYGANRAAILTYNTFLNSLNDYKGKAAIIPLSEGVLDAYPMSGFDFAYLCFDYFSQGVMGTNSYNISSRVMSGISQMVTEGKKLMITGELELLAANSENGSYGAKNFFANILGIENSGNTPYRVSIANNQITGILNFPFKGFDGDEIGDGVYLTLNNYSNLQSDPFILTTDLIKKNATSTADLIGYYDNNQNNGAGVRKVRDNGAKIVYLTFGLEAIKTETDRASFMKKCIDWLFKTGPGGGGKLTFDNTTLNFGAVDVGTTDTKKIVLTNTGDGDLNISEIRIDWDEYSAFSFNDGQPTSMVITAGQSYDLYVKFTPSAEVDFSAVVTVISDAVNGNELSVFLEGEGGVGTGAKISTNAEDNTIDLGHVKLTKNAEFNLILSNTGNEDLEIELIRISPNDDNAFEIIVDGNLYPQTILPGQQKQMKIRFAPSEIRAYMGNLYIKSNAKNQPNLNIILTGECDPLGNITTNAAGNAIDFGKINLTQKGTFDLIIKNSTAESVNISSIAFDNNSDNSFKYPEDLVFPITIGVDQEQTIQIEFAPVAKQLYEATLILHTNAIAQPTIDITLKGEGNEAGAVDEDVNGIITLNASPNPATDIVNVEFSINNEKYNEVSVYLVNMQGVKVQTLTEQVSLPGTHRFNFDTKNYPSGSYFIVAKVGNIIKRFPLSIVK